MLWKAEIPPLHIWNSAAFESRLDHCYWLLNHYFKAKTQRTFIFSVLFSLLLWQSIQQKQFKAERELFWFPVWGYSASWQKSHGGRIIEQLLTLHLPSGSQSRDRLIGMHRGLSLRFQILSSLQSVGTITRTAWDEVEQIRDYLDIYEAQRNSWGCASEGCVRLLYPSCCSSWNPWQPSEGE